LPRKARTQRRESAHRVGVGLRVCPSRRVEQVDRNPVGRPDPAQARPSPPAQFPNRR